MEVTYLGRNAFKIKGKTASVTLETNVSVEDFKIIGPGEYEIREVSVIGVADVKATIYVVEVDGLRVAYLATAFEKLTEDQMEEMGSVDILLISVDENNIKSAVACVKQIDPWVVVPTLGSTEAFLKEMGKEGITAIPKYVISMDRLPSELTVVVLEKK